MVVHTVHNIKATLEAMACRHTAEYIIGNDDLMKAEQIEGEAETLAWAVGKSPATGMVLEFGVGFGKTIKQIADHEKVGERQVHGFDSFKGLPETWRSGIPKGSFSRAGMIADDIEDSRANINLHRGLFSESIPVFEDEYKPGLVEKGIGFLHIDSDLYSSAVEVLAFAAPYLRNRSVIVFDEYWNWPGWDLPGRGEHSALMEWEVIGWKYIGYNITGQEVVIRMEQR